MSDNTQRRITRRISSILKGVVGNNDDSPTQTFSRRSKRISFSQVNNVKEFTAIGGNGGNQTIWGESYEKIHTNDSAKDGTGSSAECTTGVTSTVNEISSLAPTPTIDLFADIEDASNENVEMEITFHQSESPTKLFNQSMFTEQSESPTKLFNQSMFIEQSQSPTKLFNQSMFVEETVTTSVTNYKLMDMSMLGHANKRKTIETVSVDKAILDVTKSMKIRKMNDENLEPEIHQNTILHHVRMSVDCNAVSKPTVNSNLTRIFDADADLSVADDLPQKKMLTTKPMVSIFGPPKMFDSTSISSTDMTLAADDQSMTSSISDTLKPIGNKTHIYGHGDISAGIDQTFAVRNPLLENNREWNKNANQDASDDDISQNHVPVFQSQFDTGRDRMVEDFSISADIKFKNHPPSPNFHNTDEQGIEDLTLGWTDTTFKAEVSDDGDVHKPSAITNEIPQRHKSLTLRSIEPSTVLRDYNKESIIENASDLPTIEHSLQSIRNVPNTTYKMPQDMTLCSVVDAGSRATQTPGNRTELTHNKLSKGLFFDGSAYDHAATTDLSFCNTEPLSSTRFVPNNKLTLNFSNSDANIKSNTSSVMFNYCPTLTARQSRDLRSVASLQNNTDELCNLEPDQLKKRSDMKQLFLDISHNSSNVDMMSETKMDLVNNSNISESINDESKKCTKQSFPSITNTQKLASSHVFTDKVASNEEKNKDAVLVESEDGSTEIKTENEARCRKCLNCRKSLDGNNTTFLKKEQLSAVGLDFSIYNQFKGLASLKDVIEARKKREAARELQEQLLVDQNLEAPDIRFLWQNRNENTAEPQPAYKPEPLTCFPLRMTIQYLMRNKLRTEYTQWKYFDNYFFIGGVALRHEKIPSIRIHIKFDPKGPEKADKLNMPLLFSKVFIEECPTYLKNISSRNLLKHKHGLSSLPLNLTTILPDSDGIYKGLAEIEDYFQSAAAKVNEVELLTVEHEAMLKIEDRQCYIEKSIFDPQKNLAQEIVIKLDKIDNVGPRNVFFQPVCETTNDFKNLPIGLPFLRAFLVDPKSYLLPFLEG